MKSSLDGIGLLMGRTMVLAHVSVVGNKPLQKRMFGFGLNPDGGG